MCPSCLPSETEIRRIREQANGCHLHLSALKLGYTGLLQECLVLVKGPEIAVGDMSLAR